MKNLYIFINYKKDEQKDNKDKDELTENLYSTSNQKADGPDLYGFCKTLLFLVNNGFLINFLKKLGRDVLYIANEFVEIGKSKICFNFNNLSSRNSGSTKSHLFNATHKILPASYTRPAIPSA